MDLDTIMTTTQAVAAHAGVGAVGAVAAYQVIGRTFNEERMGLVAATVLGTIAAITGPELFGPQTSAYLHQATAGEITLGTIGAVATGAATGFALGIIPEHEHTRVLGGISGGAVGIVSGTALYLGAQALNYLR